MSDDAPSFGIPNFKIPELRLPKVPVIQPPIPAKWMYERLVRQINEFEDGLSASEEIGARFISAPGEGVIHFEDMGYWGPDMLIFHGKNEHGRPVQVLQHYTQMSVTLTVLPVEDREPRRVGFVLMKRLEGDQET